MVEHVVSVFHCRADGGVGSVAVVATVAASVAAAVLHSVTRSTISGPEDGRVCADVGRSGDHVSPAAVPVATRPSSEKPSDAILSPAVTAVPLSGSDRRRPRYRGDGGGGGAYRCSRRESVNHADPEATAASDSATDARYGANCNGSTVVAEAAGVLPLVRRRRHELFPGVVIAG